MVGFTIEKSETGVRTKYAQNPRSMLENSYNSLFWICRKPTSVREENNENITNEQNGEIPNGNIYNNGHEQA